MLLIIGVLITLTAAVILILPSARLAESVNPAKLGWMSERWLAEHRASRPS